MNAADYDAVVYDGEIYCVGCLPDNIDIELDDVHPIFAGSEWDYIPRCCDCGEIIDSVQLIGDE